MRLVLLGLIRLYQVLVSPLLGPRCRFYPSCSRYAYLAVEAHGALRGTYLALHRLLRCHPWNPGGVDLVPPRGAGRPSPTDAGRHRRSPAATPSRRGA